MNSPEFTCNANFMYMVCFLANVFCVSVIHLPNVVYHIPSIENKINVGLAIQMYMQPRNCCIFTPRALARYLYTQNMLGLVLAQ